MSNADARRGLSRLESGGGGWGLSLREWAAVAVFIFGLLLMIGGILLVTREGGNVAGFYAPGDNCSVVTCVGEPGKEGKEGRPGEPGADGKPGRDGRDGRDGNDGPAGVAICLNDNPACLQGERGYNGTKGDTGKDGPRGYRGLTGLPGKDGLNGFNGTNGIDGINGTDGGIGPQGPPGNCSCLDLGEASYTTVNVTESLYVPPNSTLTLGGTMTCPGGGLDASCFGLSTCPNFTYCDLRVTSLSALDLIAGTEGFYVDASNLSYTGYAPFISSVTFGSSADFPENRHGYASIYATNAALDGYSSMYVRALNGQLYLQTGGASSSNHINLLSLSAQIIANAAKGIVLTTSAGNIALNAGTASLNLATSGGVAQLSATTTTVTTTAFTVVDTINSHTWLQTFASTYDCPVSPPGPLVASGAGAHDLIGAGVDLVLSGTSRLMSTATDGLIKSTGLNMFCNAILKTSDGSPMQLGDNPTDIIDVRGLISNGATNGKVKFNDGNGVDFQDTPLYNTFGNGVLVRDAVGLRIDDGNAATSVSGLFTNVITSLGANLTIVGDLDVQGDITATGTITPSDDRIKEDVKTVDPLEDLEAILRMPRRVSFKYKKAYQQTTRTVKADQIYEGFIAQEMEAQGFPTLVSTRSSNYKMADGTVIQDLKGLYYEMAVPYLIGAIRALREEQLHLKAEVARLSRLEKHIK